MNIKKEIIEFANKIEGKFSNREQSIKYPKDFAYINLFFIALPWDLFNGPWLYSEQSFNYDPWAPYRQNFHNLSINNGTIIMKSYGISNRERIAGLGFSPVLINSIDKNQIQHRKGCNMHFRKESISSYSGEIEEGNLCIVTREAKEIYVKSKVLLKGNKLLSLDEGYDRESGSKAWGSDNGQIEFMKVKSINNNINETWL